jgi:hypothetical protein
MIHIINPVYYQDFILSGKPEFTLKSLKTGNEEIFVVRRNKYDGTYWVNNRLREWLGKLKLVDGASENLYDFDRRTGNMNQFQQKQMDIFYWFWTRAILIELGNLDTPSRMPHILKDVQLINHTGRCGHCHRELTHPESIPIGIGPDCFKKLGLTPKQLITSP